MKRVLLVIPVILFFSNNYGANGLGNEFSGLDGYLKQSNPDFTLILYAISPDNYTLLELFEHLWQQTVHGVDKTIKNNAYWMLIYSASKQNGFAINEAFDLEVTHFDKTYTNFLIEKYGVNDATSSEKNHSLNLLGHLSTTEAQKFYETHAERNEKMAIEDIRRHILFHLITAQQWKDDARLLIETKKISDTSYKDVSLSKIIDDLNELLKRESQSISIKVKSPSNDQQRIDDILSTKVSIEEAMPLSVYDILNWAIGPGKIGIEIKGDDIILWDLEASYTGSSIRSVGNKRGGKGSP